MDWQPQGAVDPSELHWHCPQCGTFDGPISAGECDACFEQGDSVRVQRLIPSPRAGAVSADERAELEELRRFKAWALRDEPEYVKANATLKHRVRELEAELATSPTSCRSEVWVHDERPSDDEVRTFYEIPDRVAQMVRTAACVEGESFAGCLHNLVLEREGAVADVKRLTRALKEGRSGR